jgi:glycopeptide antibiotics resistance protein
MGHIASRRPISREPLINALHRRIEWVGAGLCAALIVYLTWLPLFGGARVDSSHVSIQDILQNILLYVPLGFFVALAQHRRRPRGGQSIAFAVTTAAILSVIGEAIQLGYAGRVSTMMDVVANTCGGCIGSGLTLLVRAGRRELPSLSRAIKEQPRWCALLIVIGVHVALSCVPFQLDLTPAAAGTLFNPAVLTALTPTRAFAVISGIGDVRAQHDAILDLIATALSMLGIGWLATQALTTEYCLRRRSAILASAWIALSITLIVLGLQVFIRGKALLVVHLPIALCGGILGASLAPCGALSKRSFATLGLVGFVATLGLIAARACVPYDFCFTASTLAEQLSDIGWLPLVKSFESTMAIPASSDIAATCGRYSVAAAFGVVFLRAGGMKPLRRRVLTVVLTLTAFSCVCEGIQLGLASRIVDVTDVCMAIVGASLGVVAMEYWKDAARSYAFRSTTSHPGASSSIALST